jgi:hypothetical protein
MRTQLFLAEKVFEQERVQMTDSHHSLDVASSLFDIVDDLLANDLLGLLLSTIHFQRYCKIRAQEAGISYAGALLTFAACPAAATKFQRDSMQKFSGLHIAECSFETPSELSKHLNKKLKQFSESDFTPETYIKLSEEVENAWKYRRATQGIRA